MGGGHQVSPAPEERDRSLIRGAVFTTVCLLVVAGCDLGAESSTNRNNRAAVERVRAEWNAELARGVRERPSVRFPNLSRLEFLRRLRAAAERYDFEIVEAEFLKPKQLAPRIVVQSEYVERLARAYPRFQRSIDPKASSPDDRLGWTFEGFYFEARDDEGVPAFIVFHWWRAAKSVGGGQWAREESLYPFAHG